jgi:hypothetical protein
MSDQWLCLIDGQKLGPLSFTRLKQLAEAGRLKGDDYVRPATDEQWLVAKNVPNLIPAPAVTPDRAESTAPVKRRHSGPLPVAAAIVERSAAVPHRSGVIDNVPRGKVVASPPPPRAAAADPPPVHSAPFLIDSGAAHEPATPHRGHKKQNNAMPLMIGGVAVVGVLAVVLVLVLSGTINLSGSPTAVANADTEKTNTKPLNVAEEFSDEEANPAGESADTNEPPKQPAARKNVNKALATVKQFRDISKLKNIKLPPAQIAITGLWLSASEQGQPYTASAEGGDKTAKFLVIKLQIDNAPGAAPMDYQGWGDEALLFDDADQAIQPLPPGKSPERIAKQRIEPGGSLSDTLVFPLASVEFEKLRLVLPHETVGIKDAKSFGLELPRGAIGRGVETQLANSKEQPVNAQVRRDQSPMEIVDKAAAPMPQPKPAAGKAKADDDELGLNKLKAKADERDKMEQKK